MKNKIFSIINIAIDVMILVLCTFVYFNAFEKAFNKNTLCGILITFGWIMLCIICALTLSKDVKKVGEEFEK